MSIFPLRTPAALALALGAVVAGCASLDSGAQADAPFSIAVIGDVPYGKTPTDTTQLQAHPRFIAALSNSPEVSLVAHIGDIHSGKQYCTEAYNQTIADHWKALRQPLVYIPGDNEWMDCHKVKEGGGSYNKATGQIDYVTANGQPVDYAKGHPLANLEQVRRQFFAKPGQTLGSPMAVHSQAQEFNPAFPADKAYVENVWWEKSGVLFVTLNIPGGSNNGTDPWYNAPTMSAEQKDEVAQRTAATLRWIEAAFNRASTVGDVGVVILSQADMWDLDDAETGAAHVSGYRPYVDKIAESTKAYGMPVLMVVGDSHTYRSDNPLDKGAAAYAVHPVKASVANFHRIVVHGESMPMEWLQIRIDPRANAPHGLDAFGPFSWKRVQPVQ